jgi:hypothetical protein
MTYYYVVNGYLNRKVGGDPPSSTYVAESPDGILTYVDNNKVVKRIPLPQTPMRDRFTIAFVRYHLQPSEPGIASSSDGSPVSSGPGDYEPLIRKRKRTKAKTKRKKCRCKS